MGIQNTGDHKELITRGARQKMYGGKWNNPFSTIHFLCIVAEQRAANEFIYRLLPNQDG
jgi:hypothetical protein